MPKKKSKEITVEIKPEIKSGTLTLANPVVIRQGGNVKILSGKVLGDLQRHYDEYGYKIFDWVFEKHPLAYFAAIISLVKVHRVEADLTHHEGSKPQSIDEILDKVEARAGPGGRAAFAKFLEKIKPNG